MSLSATWIELSGKIIVASASVIGALIAFANYCHDHGTSGKRKAELENASARLPAWETRVKIQETTLVGEEPLAARAQAQIAMLAIWEQANDNLEILAERDLKPVPRQGLSKLRVFFLAYKPERNCSEYMNRVMYWSMLAGISAHISYGFLVLWRYARFNAATKVEFRELMLETKAGQQITVRFFALLLILMLQAIWFWRMGRYEKAIRRLRHPAEL